MRQFYFIFVIVVWSLRVCLVANQHPIDDLITQANQKGIHHHKKWHQLLHYKPNLIRNGVKSQVVSPNFFFAVNGDVDPKAELIATITHYFVPTENGYETHPQCRFPARYMWLKSQLDWPKDGSVDENCREFLQWSNVNQVNAIEAVFATGYFGNPASFYGHILLKFKTPSQNRHIQLLDRSINFGAMVPEREHPLRFLVKGILGGYNAIFSDQYFYRHHHYYAETELRDLWSYELILSASKKQLLIAHLWELMGMEFKYYFFDRNCAYYMADLLQLVIETPLLHDVLPWSIPSTVFDQLTDTKNKTTWVSSISYFPSRQSEFYSKYGVMSPSLKKIIQRMMNPVREGSPFNMELPAYQALSVKDKVKVIECLMDYNAFLSVKNKQDSGVALQKKQLLIARLNLKEMSPKWPTQTPIPPHFGQKPTRVLLGSRYSRLHGFGAVLNLRAAYYDFLSISPGRPKYSSLRMLDAHIAQNRGSVGIDELTIIHIERLGISTTGLTQDRGLSWNVQFGITRDTLALPDATCILFQGGVGKAIKLNSSLVVFGMLDARVTANDMMGSYLYPRVSTIIEPQKWVAIQLTAGYRKQTYNQKTNYIVINSEARLGVSRDWDVRLSYEKDVVGEFKGGISLYF